MAAQITKLNVLRIVKTILPNVRQSLRPISSGVQRSSNYGRSISVFGTCTDRLESRNQMFFGETRWLATTSDSGEKRQSSSFNVQDGTDFKDRVLNSKTPIIVDFYADWCGPCKMLGPRLEKVIDNRKGKILLAKVNVDDNSELAMDYGVRSVPTVIGFRNGQPVDQFVGMQEEETIDTFVSKISGPE